MSVLAQTVQKSKFIKFRGQASMEKICMQKNCKLLFFFLCIDQITCVKDAKKNALTQPPKLHLVKCLINYINYKV